MIPTLRRARPWSPDPAGARASALGVSEGQAYTGHYGDATVDEMAREMGAGSLNDNGIWGENAEPVRPFEELMAAFGVASHLIGHELRGALAGMHATLEKAMARAELALARAVEAVDEHCLRQIEVETLRRRIRDDGLALPHWLAHSLRYGLALVGIVLGDLALISVAFQLFGLSDDRIFGVPYTDELHLAAMTSVAALVVLAHVAGKNLRAVVFDYERRRREADEDARAALPRPSRAASATAAACSLAALALLAGIADVRAGYLAESGVDARGLAFAGVQGGIFLAALALAVAHAHPHGREWVDANRLARAARRRMDRTCGEGADSVATVNGLVGRADAAIAQAGHHMGAARHDTTRQILRMAWVSQLHYPEPVSQARLLPDDLAQPAAMSAAEARDHLMGVVPAYGFRRMTTQPLVARRVMAQRRIEAARNADHEPGGGNPNTAGDPEEMWAPVPAAAASSGNGASA